MRLRPKLESELEFDLSKILGPRLDPKCNIFKPSLFIFLFIWLHKEVESSRTHLEVLGLGLEAYKSSKMSCSRLEDSTVFDSLKMGHGHDLLFFYFGNRQKPRGKFGKNFFFWRSLAKFFGSLLFLFFFGEHLRLVSLVPWPWPRAFLALASRGSVLEKSILGLGLRIFLSTWHSRL